jgi:MutS domain V
LYAPTSNSELASRKFLDHYVAYSTSFPLTTSFARRQIVDEFGKGESAVLRGKSGANVTNNRFCNLHGPSGTSPASGIALLSSALRHFSKVKCKVICTSHFLELFSMGLVVDGVDGIKALRMAVQIPETTEDSAQPLFTLQDGVASSSAGIVCARMAGVKDAVIERAHEVVDAIKKRSKVQPLMEILREELNLTSSAKAALVEFFETDWKTASDSDIDEFLAKIVLM